MLWLLVGVWRKVVLVVCTAQQTITSFWNIYNQNAHATQHKQPLPMWAPPEHVWWSRCWNGCRICGHSHPAPGLDDICMLPDGQNRPSLAHEGDSQSSLTPITNPRRCAKQKDFCRHVLYWRQQQGDYQAWRHNEIQLTLGEDHDVTSGLDLM